MDYKDKFSTVIREDEEILWTGAINKVAYRKTTLRELFLIGLFPMFMPFMILAFTIFIGLTIYFTNKSANNIFFCITNKQLIKRKGLFTTDYQRISLSSVGEININTNIFDSKSPESATLRIIVKNYNSSANAGLAIPNLLEAHKAYKIISKHIDNEAIKIKQI